MKRPARGTAAGTSGTKLAATPAVANGLSPSALKQLDRVLKNKQRAGQVCSHHFQVISAINDIASLPTGPSTIRPAIAAGNLRDEAELIRLTPIVEQIAALQKRPLILVAGLDANRTAHTAGGNTLRHALENFGAVFIERPLDAASPEALAAFLEREYSPDATVVEAVLVPLPRVRVLENHDITPYLQPRPAVAGDHYFLSHQTPIPGQKKS
jgi:hypothetical protein